MIKYQTKDITIATGSAAQATDYDVELDKGYRFVTGVVVSEKTNGGISSYDIGLSDDTNTYHHLTDKSDWIPGSGLPLDQRYKSISIINGGQAVKIRVKPDAVVVSPLRIQVTFRLQKEDEGNR